MIGMIALDKNQCNAPDDLSLIAIVEYNIQASKIDERKMIASPGVCMRVTSRDGGD